MTKFESQDLYIIKIKYWSTSGSGFPPSLMPALQNIGILHHKKAELSILLQHSVGILRAYLATVLKALVWLTKLFDYLLLFWELVQP